jgi:NAD+ synthase
MNAKGQVVTRLAGFEEEIKTVSTSLPAPSLNDGGMGEEERLYKALTLALHDYVVKNNCSSVLLGLSGGIDSALVAAMAVDALGAGNVRCVMMPSPFTAQISLNDAQECADALGCRYDIIPIDGAMASFGHALPGLSGLAHENLQSRLRGVMLMALSNSTGALVLSTGNKSEMAVGYATLYGDMNGAFNPLKDVYKTQVYALARWRNSQKKSAVIPERILTRAPSAELREGQTDQDTLPPYDLLDRILFCLIEEDLSVGETAACGGFDLATVRMVARLVTRAEFKRRQSCPGPKISARAFGRERRYPVTNAFADDIEKP